jgi:hypothetical protein
MRVESSVTTISWIPSEAIEGSMKVPFEAGLAHYDDPPPDRIDDLAALQAADRFRFANELRGWVEFESGRPVAAGYGGGGRIGSTTLRLGSRELTLEATALPDLRTEPEYGDSWVRFVQTAGGRTGAPAPRRVKHPPFVKIEAPTAWSTLSLTVHADGRAEHALTGASPFPRHWVYDASGALVAKTGLIDFKHWSQTAFGKHSPWGDADTPAFATAVETALERELSARIMRADTKPRITKLPVGANLVEQGDEGRELFVLLDGVLAVEVDGEPLAELGPGAVLGERAVLEGGRRTSTLRAVTPCKVAVAAADQLAPKVLDELRSGHRREHGPSTEA